MKEWIALWTLKIKTPKQWTILIFYDVWNGLLMVHRQREYRSYLKWFINGTQTKGISFLLGSKDVGFMCLES